MNLTGSIGEGKDPQEKAVMHGSGPTNLGWTISIEKTYTNLRFVMG